MGRIDNYDAGAENWRKDGACAGSDPELFFPRSQKEQQLIAAIVCGDCAVKAACLEYALENQEDHGVWGGATEQDRREIRKTRRNEQASA